MKQSVGRKYLTDGGTEQRGRVKVELIKIMARPPNRKNKESMTDVVQL